MTTSKTNTPFSPGLTKWFPIILAMIIHTVTIVWWAATINAGQASLEKDMSLLVTSIKEIRDEQKSRTRLVYSVDSHEKKFEHMEARLLALEQRYRNPFTPDSK